MTSGCTCDLFEHTLYADYNNSCDIVTFYDENFNVLLTVQDCVENNLMEAMIKIWNNSPEVEVWSLDDIYKQKNIKHENNK